MDLLSLDHIHLNLPDLERAQALYGPFFGGEFTPVYGGPELNAYGTWNTKGGDFLQVIDAGRGVFGGSHPPERGLLAVSFRVEDVDAGIAQAEAAGLVLRSRVGSEEAGFGKNVVQAQFLAGESFGLPVELVERQIPGDPHEPLDASVVDHIEHWVPELDAPVGFFEKFLGSPFGAVVVDEAAGAKSVRHPGFGIQFKAPMSAEAAFATRLEAAGPGPHAIAFQSRDLAADVASAGERGLRVARRFEGDGFSEVEFEAEDEVVVKLVRRG